MKKDFEVIYDISIPLGAGAVDWPGLPPYSRELVSEMKTGGTADISKLTLTCHVGTHVDTPSHFILNGKNLDQYPVADWILPAQVISIEDSQAVRPSELTQLDIRPGEAILFQTDNSRMGRCVSGVFTEDYVYITPEAADFLIQKEIAMVGIDYGGVDRFDDSNMTIHHKLLGSGIRIVESINLKDIPTGRYTLFCLPLRISGAEGAPARAVLVR
jgi:arylformamidase